MELNLIVVNGQHLGPSDTCMPVQVDVFSIGRGSDNSWVLPDPELHISNKHCVIHRKNNEFHLTDISTNGVYLNGADQPIGRGSSIVLKQGDLFTIGNFDIKVELSEIGTTEPVGRSFEDMLSVDALTGETPGFAQILGQDDDTTPAPVPNIRSAQAIPPEKESIRVPSVVPQVMAVHEDKRAEPSLEQGVIPENWLDDLGASETVSAAVTPAPLSEQTAEPELFAAANTESFLAEEISSDTLAAPAAPEFSNAPLAGSNQAAGRDFELFLEAAGVSGALAQNEKNPGELARELGELLRLLVQGIVEALATRSLVKSEFRLQQTMIRPVENNPLKFAPTGIEALKIMMMSGSDAYLPASAAAEEGFRDIQAHQLAMMSGIQSAFEHLLSRFEPARLEESFTRRPRYKSKGILGRQQVDYWKEYQDFYEEICSLMKDDFQSLFANEFGKAYEERLRALK